ncbi:hypothetical protein [Pseudomonas sp. TE3610]
MAIDHPDESLLLQGLMSEANLTRWVHKARRPASNDASFEPQPPRHKEHPTKPDTSH